MRKRTMSLLICGVALLVAGAAQADNIVEFEMFRADQDGDGTADLYAAQTFVEMPGATAVDLLPQGGGTVAFTAYGGGNFGWASSDHATLAGLNTEIGGTHTLRIMHGGGVSNYQYAMGQITDGMFPNLPTLDAVPANIAQDYNFQWTWAGTADGMWADAQIFGKFYKEEESDGGSFFVGTTTSWIPDSAPETGAGEFLIAYEFEGDVEAGSGIVVSGWTLLSGPDIFGAAGDEILDFAESEDIAVFTVVPEPATLSLLALGACLALLRKRK